MSKRLMRVTPDEIAGKLSVLQKHTVNLVLFNGNTIFGRLVSADAARLVLKDTRDHAHEVLLADVYEVIYDDSKAPVPPSRHLTI